MLTAKSQDDYDEAELEVQWRFQAHRNAVRRHTKVIQRS